MRTSVFGTGYLGAVHAADLAALVVGRSTARLSVLAPGLGLGGGWRPEDLRACAAPTGRLDLPAVFRLLDEQVRITLRERHLLVELAAGLCVRDTPALDMALALQDRGAGGRRVLGPRRRAS